MYTILIVKYNSKVLMTWHLTVLVSQWVGISEQHYTTRPLCKTKWSNLPFRQYSQIYSDKWCCKMKHKRDLQRRLKEIGHWSILILVIVKTDLMMYHTLCCPELNSLQFYGQGNNLIKWLTLKTDAAFGKINESTFVYWANEMTKNWVHSCKIQSDKLAEHCHHQGSTPSVSSWTTKCE